MVVIAYQLAMIYTDFGIQEPIFELANPREVIEMENRDDLGDPYLLIFAGFVWMLDRDIDSYHRPVQERHPGARLGIVILLWEWRWA